MTQAFLWHFNSQTERPQRIILITSSALLYSTGSGTTPNQFLCEREERKFLSLIQNASQVGLQNYKKSQLWNSLSVQCTAEPLINGFTILQSNCKIEQVCLGLFLSCYREKAKNLDIRKIPHCPCIPDIEPHVKKNIDRRGSLFLAGGPDKG